MLIVHFFSKHLFDEIFVRTINITVFSPRLIGREILNFVQNGHWDTSYY
jgi:hypothetical protein